MLTVIGGGLWERMLCPASLVAALDRVGADRGVPGADGVAMGVLRPWLGGRWGKVREEFDIGVLRP